MILQILKKKNNKKIPATHSQQEVAFQVKESGEVTEIR